MDYITRLIKERDDLKEKYLKLNNFLMSNEAMEHISNIDYILLISQKAIMSSYLEILNARLKIKEDK